MTYLFDSSAWLAHLFGESGVEEINRIFADLRADVNISVLSISEVFGRLRALGKQDEWSGVWAIYAALFDKVIPADEAIAHRALELRTATPGRLPTIDGLIAATASVHGLTLVHSDPHFATIPVQHLRQLRLPAKGQGDS